MELFQKEFKSTDNIPNGFYRGRIPLTQDALKKISIALSGKKHSPETKRKMSIAAKKRWSNSTNIDHPQMDWFH
jgi:hypothetical protein